MQPFFSVLISGYLLHFVFREQPAGKQLHLVEELLEEPVPQHQEGDDRHDPDDHDIDPESVDEMPEELFPRGVKLGLDEPGSGVQVDGVDLLYQLPLVFNDPVLGVLIGDKFFQLIVQVLLFHFDEPLLVLFLQFVDHLVFLVTGRIVQFLVVTPCQLQIVAGLFQQ